MNGPARGDDPVDRRALRRIALSVSGGALLTVATFTVAQSASASESVDQVGPGAAPASEGGAPAPAPTGGQPPAGGLEAEVRSEGEAIAETGGQVVVGDGSTSGASGAAAGTGGSAGDGPDAGSALGLVDGGTVDELGADGSSTIPPPGTDATVVVLSSDVESTGVAIASTGGNVAIGNGSSNTATVGTGGQVVAGAGPDPATTASASTTSIGVAGITTGAASAVGNDAEVAVDQQWVGVVAADGVLYLIERSRVVNTGVGVASTGGNLATGNGSTNTASASGSIGSGTTTAVNVSDGTATISTGAASAIGNDSTTTVVQVIGVTEDGSLPVVIEQVSIIVNISISLAGTGGNQAIGNASTNTAAISVELQTAIDRAVRAAIAGADIGAAPVAVSTGIVDDGAANRSTGYATITTGAASAVGNQSVTTVRQGWIGTVVGQGVIYVVQQSVIVNIGVAVADTGGNRAIGNASTNTAVVERSGAPAVTTVVAGTASNTSNGVAVVTTGRATALGSTAVTTVVQIVTLESTTATPVPYLLVQRSIVHDVTLDLATTGANTAIGNASLNQALVDQGGADDVAPDVFRVSATLVDAATGLIGGTATNVSGGSAAIVTGAAVAGVVVTDPVPEEPEPETAVPPAPPAAPEVTPAGVGPAAPVTSAGTLPYTGGDLATEAAAGLLLVAAGAAGAAVGRQRRSGRWLHRR